MKQRKIMAPEKGRVDLVAFDIPEPAAEELQVEIHASLISPGTERACILCMENTPGVFPMESGYCSAGIVTAVGKNVTGFSVGDRVASQIGHCSIANIDYRRVYPMPDGIPFEDGAFTTLVVIAMQAVRKARIELGENILIFGAGLVGQLAAKLARLSGAGKVIVADKVQKRLDLALENGADEILLVDESGWKEKLSKMTGGRMPEVVIESTGFPEPIRVSFDVCRPFGRVILLGSTRGDASVNFYKDVHKKALSIIGAHISSVPSFESYPGYWTTQDNARACMEFLSSGKLDVKQLITETVPAEQALDAFSRMLQWNTDMVSTIIKWK